MAFKTRTVEAKGEHARRIWRYTWDAKVAIDKLNHELGLPRSFVAVHIRRGDKVKGGQRETLEVPVADYARAALEHITSSCSTVLVCGELSPTNIV